ncbi:MAG TPA: efflux RND transporter periplasmic adaptor subunit [Solibacterales bacterium]|nr:efflux RND transporter periplasmic adaptor subunit [Bryobacterales bacterium]
MKRALIVAVVAAAFAGGWYLGKRGTAGAPAETGGRKILYWHDPMHPQYRSDKPGIAPDCGMKLEPVYADGGGSEGGAPKKGRILYYRDPEDPNYRDNNPGINPETGKDLEPVYASDQPGSVQISADKQQWIGVRYGHVEVESGHQVVRAAGKVTQDERLITRVHARTEGWIEKVFADFTGRAVKKGEPLLTLYSPELAMATQEYLLALKARRLMPANGDGVVQAAREHLEHWGLTREQIEEIERTGKSSHHVTMYAPASGLIATRNAFPNLRITPETELYTIVDLSRVWIVADVYESDAPLITVGRQAEIALSYLPGRKIRAQVDYILPQVDPATRTLKVRLTAPNPDLALKPDMYVEAEFHVPTGRRLVVPAEAVLHTGEREIVFVSQGDGVFEPRPVQTGLRAGGKIEIRSGLREGDRIVTSGNFLLNSESQLKWPAQPAAAQPPPGKTPAPAEHKHD